MRNSERGVMLCVRLTPDNTEDFQNRPVALNRELVVVFTQFREADGTGGDRFHHCDATELL